MWKLMDTLAKDSAVILSWLTCYLYTGFEPTVVCLLALILWKAKWR